MPVQLEQPILDDGVKFVHFFEGRILSGQDLRDQQQADRTQRRQVGRAAGAGIVEGLEVEIDDPGSGSESPVLKVLPGLALNAEGDPLECAQPAKVELVRTLEDEDGSQSIFGACADVPPGVEIPNGIGFYVLTIGPASGFQGSAPKSGLDGGGTAAGCGRRYATFGVRFRLLKLEPTTFSGVSALVKTQIATLAASTGDASQSLLRNLLAHMCLGTPQTRSHPVDPFPTGAGTSAFLQYGALDDLRASGTLTACEVPLGLFSWTLTGIGFLDLWAVRRRIIGRAPGAAFPLHASERQRAEAEASFFQFQQQLDDLLANVSNPALVRADEYFRYLPAAGYLPLVSGGQTGFTASAFYQGLTTEGPHAIEGGRVLPLFDLSFAHRAIDLQPGGAAPLIWRYTAQENASAPSSVRRYEVFATGHLPYQGDPLFEITMTAKCAECEAKLEELEDQIEALEDALEASAPTATIQGTVRDASGAVLVGVIVQLQQGGTTVRTATTSATGAFSFPGLTAGTYSARVSLAGFATLTQSVTVSAGETETITLTLNPSGATGGLFGTIVDDSGVVLPGVDVMIVDQVTGASWTVVTGIDGTYATGPLPEGDYRITVTQPDVDPIETDVRVNPGSKIFVPVAFGG